MEEYISHYPQRELGEILSSAKDRFTGSYYFTAQYDILDAPNPILRLTAGNIGTVGLPLGEAAAKQIIAHSKQAPFGMGERTLVDKDVRDTWEMDSEFVQFDNPDWAPFINELAEDVCAGLGVDFHASQPRAELYKLLLYETGSHFLPHQDTEKVDGMFATMIVILPSAFTGGAAHLSHADLSATIDYSADSLSSTSVMAWYTDVTHEIKPITSGYRLALSYNLIHTTSALRPSLPNAQGPLPQLRDVLLTWEHTGYEGPLKIVYLLDHKYSLANLRGSALKGTDAHLVSLLDAVAKELDFRLGLATIECHASGYGQGDEYEDDYDGPRRSVEFDRNTANTTILNLVNMDGQLISDELDFSAEDKNQTIPSDLDSVVEAGDHYKQEYEGYQGNSAGTLERWYRRTILVIWPSLRDPEIVYGRSYAEKALGALRETASASPNEEEYGYVEYMLGHLVDQYGAPKRDILRCVCAAACQWDDIELWRRAMCICNGFDDCSTLGSEYIVKALSRFGSNEILPSIEKILESEQTNAKRFELLEEIESKTKNLGDLMLGDWVTKKREIDLGSLRPLATGENQLLINVARTFGGVMALEHSMVPQIKSNSRPEDLLSFALALHAEQGKEDGAFKDPADMKACSHIKAELLSHAIEHEDFFGTAATRPQHLRLFSFRHQKPAAFTNSAAYIQPRLPHYPRAYGSRERMLPTDLPEQYVKACLKTENEHLIGRVVERLVEPFAPSTDPSIIDGRTSVLLNLVPYFNKLVQERSAMPAGPLPPHAKIDTFYAAAIPLLLTHMEGTTLEETEITCTVQAVAIAGGIELLEKIILPKVTAGHWGTDTYKLFIRHLRACESQFVPKAGTTSSITTIVASLIQTMINQLILTNSASTMEMLNFCYEMDSGPCYADLLSRLLRESIAASHKVEAFLLPLIPDLVDFASHHHISITAPPLVSYFKAVMSAWAQMILGPKPTLDASILFACAQRITCRCDLCADVAAFLCSGPRKTLMLHQIGAPAAKHVEYKLGNAGVSAIATWDTLPTVPRGLQVVKTNEAYQASKWATTQPKGITALKRISADENVLVEIFGDDGYKELLRALGVPWVNAPIESKPDPSQVDLTPQPSTPMLTNEDSNPLKRRKMHHADTEAADPA
ncbi:hypothetical protein BOTBODRAFT_174154 [Botryobasidium botryosum FD-172 SS1]|uniref:Prolyl 4-hydroxylase alpha subunit Fe(2+) 2OG dioxygenase domain-containing protein n=1 Tax=Botryobasidium botryosum (strain FD-172 SS1) TaxID=930990 RepID=A0A067MHV4_BOTB1|nr:hypothetical protein BOTBODRAFT_174154 [Botryobasidium botryosum FD-172 SS1]